MKFSNLPMDSENLWKLDLIPFLFTSFITCNTFYCLLLFPFLLDKSNSQTPNNLISLKQLYLTGDGVGARTCLTGEGECLIGDGDCCRANCALADGGVGDLDFGLGGILGGVLWGSCCPVAPSMTISTVAIDLASKWASIFCKREKQSPWRGGSSWNHDLKGWNPDNMERYLFNSGFSCFWNLSSRNNCLCLFSGYYFFTWRKGKVNI